MQNRLRNVLTNFLLFAFSVCILPPCVYFLSINHMWNGSSDIYFFFDNHASSLAGNATLAAVSAAVSANVALFSYLIIAWKEESRFQSHNSSRKTQ